MGTILLIDKSRLMAKLIVELLGKRGIRVNHAATIAEVFGYKGKPSLLRKELPDLIILEIMMPDMHGFDTLEKLQSMVDIKEIPVVMLSYASSETHVVESIHRGAKAFLSKPVANDKFLSVVASVAKQANRLDIAKKLAEYLPTGVRPEVSHPDLGAGEANLSYLLEVLDGNKDLLIVLVKVLVNELPIQLARIGNSIETGDAQKLMKAAHMFKGSISNLGAALITDQALQLQMAGQSRNLDNASQTFKKLKTDVDGIHKELVKWLASNGA